MALSIRRAVVLCVLLASMVTLSGCWVFSVYPLAGPTDDLVFDKFLAGNWWNPEKGCSIAFSRFPGERAYRISYTVANEAGDGCWLDKGQSASFVGTVVELGNGRFLDIAPADLTLQTHMAVTHSFYRMKVDANSLSLTPMMHETIKSLVAEDKLRGIPRSDETLVLTSNTKELREFFRSNATSQSVWNDGGKLEFQRRVDGQ